MFYFWPSVYREVSEKMEDSTWGDIKLMSVSQVFYWFCVVIFL